MVLGLCKCTCRFFVAYSYYFLLHLLFILLQVEKSAVSCLLCERIYREIEKEFKQWRNILFSMNINTDKLYMKQ